MSKHTITCMHCGKLSEQHKYASKGKFCSNKCQIDYQYTLFIEQWKAGAQSGLVGKKGISGHIRRYIFEKFDSKCVQCGWSKPHPDDGRIPLEVDHIDGNWMNTTEDNLRLLCPCCHSLTSTYKSRNRKSTRDYGPVS